MEEQNSRFAGAPWYNEKPVIDIYGAGGIGSYLSFFLARAGFNIRIHDFDYVELGNFSGQLFEKMYMGASKVNALERTIEDLCVLREYQHVNGYESRISGTEELIYYFNNNSEYYIACSCFDNMQARKDLFSSWVFSMNEIIRRNYPDNEEEANKLRKRFLFLDGRLTMESFQIFCIRGDDITAQAIYQDKALFEDSAIPDDACTMKQTSHIAAMIGAQMTAFITNYITNVKDGVEGRTVPYKYEYFAPLALQNIVELPKVGTIISVDTGSVDVSAPNTTDTPIIIDTINNVE